MNHPLTVKQKILFSILLIILSIVLVVKFNRLMEGKKKNDYNAIVRFTKEDNGQSWLKFIDNKALTLFADKNLRLISFIITIMDKEIEDKEQKDIILRSALNKFEMMNIIERKSLLEAILPAQSLLAKQIILEPYHQLFIPNDKIMNNFFQKQRVIL